MLFVVELRRCQEGPGPSDLTPTLFSFRPRRSLTGKWADGVGRAPFLWDAWLLPVALEHRFPLLDPSPAASPPGRLLPNGNNQEG